MKSAEDEQPVSARTRLLRQILQGKGKLASGEAVGRRSGARRVLSPTQERMWFLEQLTPGTTMHNLGCALWLGGPLDVRALECALTEITRRHEVLRSIYRPSGGDLEVVLLESNVSLVADRLTPEPGRAEEEQAADLCERIAGERIDVTRSRPVRFHLLRLSERRHVLALVCHHIAYDGWSQGIFLRELSALYADQLAGRRSSLPEPPLQYADFAEWDRTRKQRVADTEALRFWLDRLSAQTEPLDLPTSQSRPAAPSYAGRTFRFVVDPELTRALAMLARNQSKSLFSVLMAGYQLLLAKLARQRDVVTGTAVAHRTRQELEQVIGPFVNTVPIRSTVDMAQSFVAYLDRISVTCADALAHQEVPFEQIVKALNPPRDRDSFPIYQTMLTLQNYPQDAPRMEHLDVECRLLSSHTSRFDLALILEPRAGALDAAMEFRTELFDDQRIEWFASSFLALLRSATRAPNTPIGKLSMRSPR